MIAHKTMHLAQANVGTMRGASYEDPVMAGFVARLDPLNDIADSSRGFVWRLEDDAADEYAARVFDCERLLFNLSVWESVEALEEYVYKSGHIEAVRKRAQWFEKPTKSPFVLWWIAAGHRPTIEETKSRFDLLWTSGPSPEAFTFSTRFTPGGTA
jgi:hypothetical protein